MNSKELHKQATKFLNTHGYSTRGLPIKEENEIRKYKDRYKRRIKHGENIQIKICRPHYSQP